MLFAVAALTIVPVRRAGTLNILSFGLPASPVAVHSERIGIGFALRHSEKHLNVMVEELICRLAT